MWDSLMLAGSRRHRDWPRCSSREPLVQGGLEQPPSIRAGPLASSGRPGSSALGDWAAVPDRRSALGGASASLAVYTWVNAAEISTWSEGSTTRLSSIRMPTPRHGRQGRGEVAVAADAVRTPDVERRGRRCLRTANRRWEDVVQHEYRGVGVDTRPPGY